jgi:hypothetical protein
VIETDIFRTTEVAVYSEEARIPVSAKQPSGLVYKVQVGAFRNPLPQDHFKDFAPIFRRITQQWNYALHGGLFHQI